MNRYRVAAGIARFGAGESLALSAEQIAPRLPQLVLPKDHDGKAARVTVKSAVEFKVGEIIGLAELPRRLVDVLVPVDRPASETDASALARDEQRAAQHGAGKRAR